MVSPHTEAIDFDELEKNGLKAIDKDARYWRENDAKFRAVNQKVATYEEFRDIVLASHLKPIDKGDKIDLTSQKRTSCWNVHAQKTGTDGSQLSDIIPVGQETCNVEVYPKSAAEFSAVWRKLVSVDKRSQYLKHFPTNTIGEIFKSDIPAGVLMDVINVLINLCSPDGKSDCIPLAVDVLKQFCLSSRFSLSLMFLSESEKSSVKQLFNHLENSIEPSNAHRQDLVDLKSRYGVS